MSGTFPKWLHNRNPDTDRILCAAWLRVQGGDYDNAADLIAASVTGDRCVGQSLDALVELIEHREQCWDSPALFAYTVDGFDGRAPVGGWDVYAIGRCEEIEREVMALADRIAHKRPVEVAS